MSSYTVILMPCRGRPVRNIWLPPSRRLEDMVVEVRPTDSQISPAVRRRAEALGLTPVIRPLPRRGNLLPWICWVQPGETPQGLVKVKVSATEVSRHPVFSSLVRELQVAQRQR